MNHNEVLDEGVEVLEKSEKDALVQFGKDLAAITAGARKMEGVRRGVVFRSYEKELKRLEKSDGG